MQNNKEHRPRIPRLLAGKGYYFVLIACIAAVGVSGWLLVRSLAGRNAAETTLRAEPPSVQEPEQQPDDAPQSSPPVTDDNDDPEDAPSRLRPDTAETAAPVTDDEIAGQAGKIVVAPLRGETVLPYAMDHLTFHVTTQDWRTHDGIDIAAAVGTPVLAASAGTVSAVFDDGFLGTVVVLSHLDGVQTRYANLSEAPTVRAGQTVDAGDVIGAVGETAALETGEASHLHFAVSRNGASVDPASYLP